MLMTEMLTGQFRNRKQQSEKCLIQKAPPKPQNPQQSKTKPKCFRAGVFFLFHTLPVSKNYVQNLDKNSLLLC